MTEKPTGITANKSKREFTVTWDSGHTSIYPFGLLRAASPNKWKTPLPRALSTWWPPAPTPSPSSGRTGMTTAFTTGIICGRCVRAKNAGEKRSKQV